MKEEIAAFILAETANPIFRLVAIAVVFDTIMGVFRAIKERKFNSCVGINGAIRKVGMIVSIIFLSIADKILSCPYLPCYSPFSAAQVLVRFYVSPLTVFIIYHITQYVNTYYAIFINLFLCAISPAECARLKSACIYH